MRFLTSFGSVFVCGILGVTGCSSSQTQFAPSASSYQAKTVRGESVTENLLYSFGLSPDINAPTDSLIADAKGNLYGTAGQGGDGGSECTAPGGCGGVFRFTRSGSGFTESTIYEFAGGKNGGGPYAGLYMDSTGSLYGTATYDGADIGEFCCGTVFKLTPQGSGYTETTLYTFQGGSDGAGPTAALIADPSGALYGTTQGGGDASGDGTVYKLTPSGGGYSESILYRFKGCTSSGKTCDGANPNAALYRDSSGALYGTAQYGGKYECTEGNRCGTVYKLTPEGSGYQEATIYNFKGGTTDGANPQTSLIADSTGALYGATGLGGSGNEPACNDGSVVRGCGTVFKLAPTKRGHYKESVLYSFQGNGDAAQPQAGVIPGPTGSFYGTTALGGTANGGTVFQLVRHKGKYSDRVLYSFLGYPDGNLPRATVVEVRGTLYGTTFQGGYWGVGIVFGVTP